MGTRGPKPGTVTKTGGRQKGTRNKRTAEIIRRMEETAVALDDVLPASFKGDAHAYLMAVYKDVTNPTRDRLAAATAAIGYEKSKLASVEHKGDADNPVHTKTSIEFVVVDPKS